MSQPCTSKIVNWSGLKPTELVLSIKCNEQNEL